MAENLVNELAWLPNLIELKDYNGAWNAFIQAAYDYYARDFILDKPELAGLVVKSKRRLAYNGQDHCVVLDPRGKGQDDKPAYYYLWTTFLCESSRQYDKMLERYEKGEKMN